MDGFTNAQIEKQTIYEIYRACRLCGAGAGYKMPIIQNVVDLDSGEVELKQKVRECVQIEVHQDDKMPPLICELCVDKVNDFYEFLEMCRQTNKQTRLRLGLPPQTLPRGAPDAGDCILGVTEPIFVGNEDSNEPMRSKGRAVKAVKVKQEPESRESRNKREGKEHRSERDKVLQKRDVKKENGKDRMEPRTLRRKAPSPAPSLPSSPPRLRGAKRHHEDDVSLSRIQKSKRSEEATPRSILKRDRDSKSDEPSKVTRSREKENEKLFNNKKVKIVIKKMNLSPKPPSSKPQPKPSPRNVHRCRVCGATFDQSRSLSNHMRAHTHKTVERKATPPTPTRKDLKKIECKECRRRFNHRNLLEIHSCTGKAVKPVTEQKPVPKPLRVPASKKKTQVTEIDPKLLEQLRPLQVRISKCDPLLENRIGDHYDASDVDYDYGLDKTCVYPYIYTFRHLRIKSEPSYMVNIQDEIKKACDLDDSYVHWDSDETDSDLELTGTKKVDTLISLSMKTLFSPKLLGKVPKRRRKVKVDKAFDSILNSTSDFDTDMRLGIDNIINSLGDDKDQSVLDTDNSAVTEKIDKTDTDSWFGDDNSPVITNSYFDSLLNDTKTDNGTITKDTTDYNKSDDSIEIMSANNFSIDTDDTVPKSDISSVKDSIPLDSDDIAKSDSVCDLKETEYSDKSSACEGKTVIDSKNDISKSLTDETKSIDNNIELKNSKDGVTEEVCKVNDITTDIVTDKKDVTAETDNQKTHVNGQSDLTREFNMEDLEDVSESEMDDSTLMETLDKQIDGNV